MPVIFTLITFFSTFFGGLTGLKYKNKLHPILGFTAGVVLAVVAFDIFPEIFALVKRTGIDPVVPMLALVGGFLIFHIFEKVILIHSMHEESYSEHKHPSVGVASGLALSGHSFLDGVGIGLAFQVSVAIGVVVAIAVIAHDFADGLNTVALMLVNKNTSRRAFTLLIVDAVAPLVGVISTLFVTLPERWLLVYLGFFAGFLLYISTSDILPEAHRTRSSYQTIALTVLGIVFIFLVTRVV